MLLSEYNDSNNKFMNILLFTQNCPKNFNEPVISGMVKNPFYLSLSLVSKGHEVTVITTGDEKESWDFKGVKIHSIGRGILKGVVHAFFMEMKMFLKFLKIRKGNDFGVINVHHLNILPLLLLKKIGSVKVTIIYTAHGTSTPEMKASFKGFSFFNLLVYINGYIQHFLDYICYKVADKVVSVSMFQVEELEGLYKVPRNKIEVIYNGVEGDMYFPNNESGNELRHDLGISQKSKIILYVGRIARKKGIIFLIKNLKYLKKKIPGIRLILVMGNMGRQLDYKKEIIQYIKKENLEKSIIVKENVPEKMLPSYYNAADICVFPSTGYESIPTVIYEALACGKPVVTQGSWGIREALNEVLLSENQIKSKELGAVISKVLNNEISLQSDVANKFYWDELVNKYVRLYEDRY